MKKHKWLTIVGLVVILGSWILLTTINPQLVNLSISREATPEAMGAAGVYLCKTSGDVTADNCQGPITSNQGSMQSGFNDAVNYVVFKNSDGSRYGVVLHKDQDYRGGCEPIISSGADSQSVPVSSLASQVSSVTVFQYAPPAGGGVSLYECSNYECDTSKYTCDNNCTTGDGRVWGPYTNLESPTFRTNPYYTPDPKGAGIRSIKVDGKYLAVLGEGQGFANRCEVFTVSDPDLTNNYIRDCGFTFSHIGCFDAVDVIPIK